MHGRSINTLLVDPRLRDLQVFKAHTAGMRKWYDRRTFADYTPCVSAHKY